MFLDIEKLKRLARTTTVSEVELNRVLNKAKELKGLNLDDVAILLAVESKEHIQMLLESAALVKKEIYGNRMVLFAPIYTGNHCSNNCLYCGFRAANKDLKRISLSKDDLVKETELLLKEGHKRVLLLCGESNKTPLESTLEAIETVYSAEYNGHKVKRINIEIAPMEVDEFKVLKTANIGTYTCFQETYDPELYKEYHPTGKKANYEYRLNVMHRAMEAGIDDVGVGVLFGLADYKFEILALLEHASSLEKEFGCGPHTVSVPRIEKASGAPLTENIPFPVSDDDFRKIVAIIRMAMPYTGIILSTRESTELREELMHYGVSQLSAGSKTSPGGYSDSEDNSQFSLGDHRSLEEVISNMSDAGYIPSFCTGCYRKGRVGNDFMDLAKPGLIKKFCVPNGLTSYAEYLHDFSSNEVKEKGLKLIDKLAEEIPFPEIKEMTKKSLQEINVGKRDVYL
ncbi:[FeFe] hydrogenase H-cluster radical SAM maturase HydG [Thiospirochaeta perfilievii]|uniref:[FeFe] hydrogenase H-cluster radical SAM maturase HydG n=1 Tax=Thiospirochaeta perfilievii TaxID=252967 RepID=A0A5C1QC05_9SPIO|nr:[FeFe] hydrogenase H-cluster radical SAM maturase HydG [Thiospirochaeta perfilievii]QEN05071.1 [FeFe] hydrogenase H-cluster radical SAM maturase HydG [Thiospirochaeta perfilievii]